MTDKELIRTEIERRKEICKTNIANASGANFPYVMEMTAYDKILTFIESMPEHSNVERIGKDWKEEPVSDDLNEVADQYSQSIHSDYSNDMFDRGDIYEAVIYGAQWQKKKDDEMLTIAYMDGVEKGKKQMSIMKRLMFLFDWIK